MSIVTSGQSSTDLNSSHFFFEVSMQNAKKRLKAVLNEVRKVDVYEEIIRSGLWEKWLIKNRINVKSLARRTPVSQGATKWYVVIVSE